MRSASAASPSSAGSHNAAAAARCSSKLPRLHASISTSRPAHVHPAPALQGHGNALAHAPAWIVGMAPYGRQQVASTLGYKPAQANHAAKCQELLRRVGGGSWRHRRRAGAERKARPLRRPRPVPARCCRVVREAPIRPRGMAPSRQCCARLGDTCRFAHEVVTISLSHYLTTALSHCRTIILCWRVGLCAARFWPSDRGCWCRR